MENVQLIDDVSLDTVISVNGFEIRYDIDFVNQYRNKDGYLTNQGWEELKELAIDDYYALTDEKEV